LSEAEDLDLFWNKIEDCPIDQPKMLSNFRKVSDSLLFVSQPAPVHFGNPPNEPSNSYWTNSNWLQSRFHFSFAEYHTTKNLHFGPLRVLNDDLIQPLRGFATHPHSNAEIVTYILEGELTHKDSMGTSETLSRGAIQFMTAGTGIRHSEHNLNPTKPLRIIQMWFTPRTSQLTPNYGSMSGDTSLFKNKWAHLVSDVKNTADKTPVKINQDVNIFVALAQQGVSLDFMVSENRQAYFLCMEGDVTVKGDHESEELTRHDAAEVKGKNALVVTGKTDDAHVMIVEMAITKDSRFDGN